MRTIEVSDETAAALQSRAAAQGMSLQKWFEKLATQPSAKPRFTLDELMRQCKLEAPMEVETRAWLDAPPVGREAL
jgi:antitoxin component of MazEF toxin-antitoxin module